jgi:outer membrane PBP1 activator LpoA protein
MLLSQHWHQALATDNWIIRGQTGLLRRHSNGNVERASDLATFDGAKVRHAGIR